MIDRVDPAGTLGERDMMTAWLTYHRRTLARKIDGLTGEQASPEHRLQLTLLGLVRHMTEVERGWIAEEFGDGYGTPAGPASCRRCTPGRTRRTPTSTN